MVYKKLNEVDIKDSLSDSEHVLSVDEKGNVVRTPKKAIQTQTTLTIDCPDFSEAGWEDDGSLKTYLKCETLGGYTIDELQELIKSGVVVRIKRDLSAERNYSVVFYDVVGFGMIRENSSFNSSFIDKTTIVFSARCPVTNAFFEERDNGIYCEPVYNSATSSYTFRNEFIIWTGDELINQRKASPFVEEEDEEEEL